jgi:hypothetical protein
MDSLRRCLFDQIWVVASGGEKRFLTSDRPVYMAKAPDRRPGDNIPTHGEWGCVLSPDLYLRICERESHSHMSTVDGRVRDVIGDRVFAINCATATIAKSLIFAEAPRPEVRLLERAYARTGGPLSQGDGR